MCGYLTVKNNHGILNYFAIIDNRGILCLVPLIIKIVKFDDIHIKIGGKIIRRGEIFAILI